MFKSVLFAFFFFSPSFAAIKVCVSEEQFKADNISKLGSKDLVSLFNEGTFLGEGSFGRVVEIPFGRKRIAVKRVKVPIYTEEIKATETELQLLKEMNGKKSTVELFGCAAIGKYLYILQEKMYKDFESATQLVNYKAMNVEKRMSIFVKILQKFSILHKMKIIHEDVKPENFMSLDKEITDVRIIDLGLSSRLNTPVYGGSPVFNCKEKVGTLPDKADPRHDIYALGLSFAVMETSFNDIFGGISASCFKSYMSSTCYQSLKAKLQRGLVRTGMADFLDIFVKATGYRNDDRYNTVDEMITDIQKILDSMHEESKSLNIQQNMKELMASKRAAEAETDANKQIEADKDYLKKDAFINENKNLLKNDPNLYKGGQQNVQNPLDQEKQAKDVGNTPYISPYEKKDNFEFKYKKEEQTFEKPIETPIYNPNDQFIAGGKLFKWDHAKRKYIITPIPRNLTNLGAFVMNVGKELEKKEKENKADIPTTNYDFTNQIPTINYERTNQTPTTNFDLKKKPSTPIYDATKPTLNTHYDYSKPFPTINNNYDYAQPKIEKEIKVYSGEENNYGKADYKKYEKKYTDYPGVLTNNIKVDRDFTTNKYIPGVNYNVHHLDDYKEALNYDYGANKYIPGVGILKNDYRNLYTDAPKVNPPMTYEFSKYDDLMIKYGNYKQNLII